MVCIVLLVIFLVTGSASAWFRPHHRYHHPRVGIFIGPPIIWAPPVHYRSDYPPNSYYDYGYRVWAPGYWEERWTPYGWERVWVPGYWQNEY